MPCSSAVCTLLLLFLPSLFSLQIISFNDGQSISPITLQQDDSILFIPQFTLNSQRTYTLTVEPCSGSINTYLNESNGSIQLLEPKIPQGQLVHSNFSSSSFRSILIYATLSSTFSFLFTSHSTPSFSVETNTNLLQIIYTSHLKSGEIRYKSGNYIHMTFYPPKIHSPINFTSTNDYDTYEYAIYALSSASIAKDDNLCNLATVCGIDYCQTKLALNQQFQSYACDANNQIQVYGE